MSHDIYLLPIDRAYAEARITVLEKEIQDLGPDFNDAFTQSSETWHDNSPFEAVRDKQSMLAAELHKLRTLVRHATLTPPKAKRGTVGIGHTVELADGNKYQIAGDWTHQAGHHQDGMHTVSCHTLIAKALLGKKVGDEVKVARLDTAIMAIEK